jgi:hypothetical protein
MGVTDRIQPICLGGHGEQDSYKTTQAREQGMMDVGWIASSPIGPICGKE